MRVRAISWAWAASAAAGAVAVACGSSGSNGSSGAGDGGGAGSSSGGIVTVGADGGPVTVTGDWDAGSGMVWVEGGNIGADPPVDAAKPEDDAGGYLLCDGGTLPADRFITSVVTFTPGPCAGFGQADMPAIIEGPPVGGGASQGGNDVLSLGNGGSIVVSFGANAIVDGPGDDFIVFENPFDVAGNPDNVYAEPGEVSVSNDGVTWTTFPCTATSFPYGACAGWHPVLSSPSNCISPVDPAAAGGDAFDLSAIGVTSAKYVRIVDKTSESCPEDGAPKLSTNGFDLDAIAIVNALSAN